MAKARYFLVFLHLISIVVSEQSASFYGESYISVPLEDASSTTDLHLHFKTHRPHGLLLLAAGSTDNLVLEVKAGRVEVRINLGSGEAVVSSSPSVRLDDTQWHEVRVNRSGASLELTVDGIMQGSVDTPGSFDELNVQEGIFLGGLGTYSGSDYASLKNFRGCMKDVLFNGNDILTTAKDMKSVKNTFEVTWECDSEFSAGSDVPVSFLSETSFVAFSRFHVWERGAFACDFKTRSKTAVLLFNSGHGDFNADFLSLEIIDGIPHLSLNSGSGIVEVVLEMDVSDGKWHELDLSISQSIVELRVDNVRNTTRFGGEKSYFNLAGHLFVGGLGLKARSHALRLGLKVLQGERTMKGSMLGCIRNIVINSRLYGFRDVQISRHIDSVCTWPFPCASDPCIDGAECFESGENFQCICDQPVCKKEAPEKQPGLPEEDFKEMIAVEVLNIREGEEVVINTNTIDVIFDYRRFRIRETAIRFRVLIPPRFGQLEVDRGQRQSESFTLLDLLTAKVHYTHDGTDSETDDITIEMSITGHPDLPQKLEGNFEFVLPIKVVLHSDPPKLYLPSGNQVNVLENSKLQITSSVVEVKDPDTKDNDLRYHIQLIRPVKSFFENYSAAGESIMSFSHEDILDGRIWFVHKEDKVVDVRLNVTDESSLSDSLVLRFLVVPLKIELTKNTGLVVPYTTSALVQVGNLSATTNVPLQNLELRYRITKLPHFGQIQRLQRGVEEWTDVDTFTQRHLNNSHLRYSHFSSDFSVSEDEFTFVVSAKDEATAEQVFKINFIPVTLNITENNRLLIHQVPYAQLKTTTLLITAHRGQIDSYQLTYSLVRAPKLGAIYVTANNRIFNPLDFDSLRPLDSNGNFTQADVDNGRVYFKFDSAGFDRREDYVDFTVKYPSSSGKMLRFWVEYIPLDTAIRFTNNGVRDVAEGGLKVIDKSHLYLEMDGYKEFQFSLIHFPKHGNISYYDPRANVIVEPGIEEFSSADLSEGRVVYQHDDSENDRDSFVFAAIPLFKSEEEMPEEIQEFTGTFHISVTMRNDNPPERLVDKVFHVVTNRQKKLTIADLAFADKDIHYNSSSLQYRRQNIPNGEILMASTNTPVYQFMQSDLEEQKLIFQHSGPQLGRAAIFVSDGQFYWTGLFEIQASDPYIKVENNTGLIVFRGETFIITPTNLSLETNLDFPPGSYSFILTEEPRYGTLKINNEDSAEFTYAELIDGKVEYSHDGSNSEEDSFRFAVVHGDVQTQGNFSITIKDDNMLHPPEVVHNQLLQINEGQTVKITDSHLLLQHPSLNSEEVVFIITSPPKQGFLQIRGTPLDINKPMQFSQGEINRGMVEYVQTESIATEDQFVFDVDSDTKALKHLVFSIEIIPSSLPVRAGNLTVVEGGRTSLSSETLKTIGSQYKSENLIYEVIDIPAHGYILNTDDSKKYNVAFSSHSLVAGKIVYQHDDSESLNDSFAVVASREDGSLKSQLVNVKVTVTPEDDQPPRVVVNKGLSVWADSVTLITSDYLHAEDPDTSSNDIIFTVSSPSNGHLAFLNNTFHKISKFSQWDIDAGHVVFVHQGESHGQFNFQASDGTNNDILRVFHVRAHPVVLQLRHSGPLKVFPNTIHPLSNDSLLAVTTSANFSKPIVFTVVEPRPYKGKLVTKVAGRPLEVRSFTQEEVNSGKVFYQHTDYMSQWRQSDSIHLEVSTAYATPLTGEVCDVDISFGNINFENQAMLLRLYEVSVNEGSSIYITRTHFDSTELLQRLHAFQEDIIMTFEVVTLPSHGKLYLRDTAVTPSVTFSQDDIDAERLRYEHDDSDTTADAFSFSVEIKHSTDKEKKVVPTPKHILNFSLEIVPVNDQQFHLVTQNPSLRVLQGGEAVLTPNNLLTVDPDTPPFDIIYTVLSEPVTGRLVRNGYTSMKVETFTQEDINEGALVFMQNGTEKSDTIFFKVTDGKFPAYYKMLVVFVIALEIDVSNAKPVELMQSESSVYISGKFLNVTTNGDREDLQYKVMIKPQFGRLLRRGQEVQYFSQNDVDMDSILYVMHNFSHSEDSFHCDINVEDVNVTITVLIVVKPLVKQLPLVAPAGASVAITKENLDASELAARTGDNPTFEIINPPRHGQILRKLRKKRELIAQPVLRPVDKFTFEDIVYAKIFYVSNSSAVDGPPIADSFSYILRANNAQPASGKFLINLDESEDEYDENIEGNLDTGAEVFGSQLKNNDAMIVGITLGVLLGLVVVVIVVVLIWRRRQSEEDHYPRRGWANKPRPYISGPLQLEQPHVHIEPQQCLPSPGGGEGEDEERCLMRHSGNLGALPVVNVTHDLHESSNSRGPFHSIPRSPDLSRVEISSAVPDCKVTPLIEEKGEFEGSKSEASMVGDRQSGRSSTSTDLYDWTLMDPELLQHYHTETPVLRENQYWV